MSFFSRVVDFFIPVSKFPKQDKNAHVFARKHHFQVATSLWYLKRLREVINAGWIQNEEAIDNEGKYCPANSSRAEQYSLCGAIWKIQGEPHREDQYMDGSYYDFVWRLFNANQSRCLFAFNDADGRTKEEVLALIDKAIRNCK